MIRPQKLNRIAQALKAGLPHTSYFSNILSYVLPATSCANLRSNIRDFFSTKGILAFKRRRTHRYLASVTAITVGQVFVTRLTKRSFAEDRDLPRKVFSKANKKVRLMMKEEPEYVEILTDRFLKNFDVGIKSIKCDDEEVKESGPESALIVLDIVVNGCINSIHNLRENEISSLVEFVKHAD